MTALTRANARELLRVYLNDHLLGSVAAIELTKRCRSNNEGTPLAKDLGALLGELEEDRAALRQLMRTLGLRVDPVKQVFGYVGERVGRLKLNGQLLGYSPLSRLVELEGLCVGVDAKLSLWRSLERIADAHQALTTLDLERLIERAVDQRRVLEAHRVEAATAALAPQ